MSSIRQHCPVCDNYHPEKISCDVKDYCKQINLYPREIGMLKDLFDQALEIREQEFYDGMDCGSARARVVLYEIDIIKVMYEKLNKE